MNDKDRPQEVGQGRPSDPVDAGGLPPASFHEDSGALRFWVALPNGPALGAMLPRRVLYHRFAACMDGSDAVTTYLAHRAEIDAAVVRRVAEGSLEPVILRENDLPVTPP